MNGYIYKISCKDQKIKECYIGSTNNFKRRIRQHTYNSNHCYNEHHNLYGFINNNGTINNFNFEMLLKVNVDERKELLEIEKQFIKSHNNLLNKYIPNRNQKEYYHDNYDILKQKRLIKYNNNREEILLKKSSTMVTCECGITLTKNHLNRHYKSIKHCQFINSQQVQNLEKHVILKQEVLP
jgi:predicted GIY-YIG superfamily endonuclease